MARVVCSVWVALFLLGCEEPECIRHSQCNSGYECRNSRCQKIATDAGVKVDGGGGKGGKGGAGGATKKPTGGTSGRAPVTMDAAMSGSTDTTDTTDNTAGTGGSM